MILSTNNQVNSRFEAQILPLFQFQTYGVKMSWVTKWTVVTYFCLPQKKIYFFLNPNTIL